MSRIILLGVPIDALNRSEAVQRIRGFLSETTQRHVATPNSEMLVEAYRNTAFCNLLNKTDLNIPDSQGLVWAAHYTHQRLPQRVTGVDTVVTLCTQLDEKTPVFFLGAGEGIAERAAQTLRQRNPHLLIVGTYAGSPKKEDASAIIQRIHQAKPHLLLVAYGAPAQDMWIADHLKDMPSVRVAMGIGGTFDFLAGTQKRAPKIFQRMGIEWFWRLVRQPKRLPRIINAVMVFPLLVMHSKIQQGGVVR